MEISVLYQSMTVKIALHELPLRSKTDCGQEVHEVNCVKLRVFYFL